jgi:uncharacterized MAPEG superfamily protein
MAKLEPINTTQPGVAVVTPPTKRKVARLIVGYQPALVLAATLLNLFAFGVTPLSSALPSEMILAALTVAAVLLVINHMWLMTATELARLKHDIRTTPEEWAAAGRSPTDAGQAGLDAVTRCHNAHRNTTENTVLFALLAGLVAMSSPPVLAACVWFVGFGAARLAYTYSYLTARTGLRGICMSLSLLALYGIASQLVLGLLM